MPVTELTGSNLCHARPGAGRALVGNGETGRVQSQRIPPVTGIAYRQEDRRVRLLNRVDLATASGQLHALPGNEKFEFFGAPSPGGRSVREITSREETERPPENRLGRSQQAPASQEPKACGRPGSADPTAPEQVSQMPRLREFRLAESQQILPLTGNRKPASDRTHWIQPAPCSSRRRSCPAERGDRQSSVSADPTRHGHRPPAGG